MKLNSKSGKPKGLKYIRFIGVHKHVLYLVSFSLFSKSLRMSGTTSLHLELEETIAEFVGKPAAMVYGMGFATNSTTLPVLMDKDGLIISDKLNHSSIVAGARTSGATVQVFQHNCTSDTLHQ